eukprot:1864949-Amphidinium_carterae.1
MEVAANKVTSNNTDRELLPLLATLLLSRSSVALKTKCHTSIVSCSLSARVEVLSTVYCNAISTAEGVKKHAVEVLLLHHHQNHHVDWRP